MKTSKDDYIHFKGFQVRPSNVKTAWEKLREKYNLDEAEKRHKVKIEMPKIEAFCVIDSDFERIRLQKWEGKDTEFEKILNMTEWGGEYSVKDVNGFTRIFWTDKTHREIHHADIYIRYSIYEKNKRKFYDILEHEVMHCLLGPVISVYR